MKKLREWLKIRRNAVLAMNCCFAAAGGAFATAAATVPYSWLTILDAFVAGFYSALLMANYLLERAHASHMRLIKIVEEQQSMFNDIMEQKAGEIAAELAARFRGEVSIVPPPFPPTKH